jgi:hypothetical protein
MRRRSAGNLANKCTDSDAVAVKVLAATSTRRLHRDSMGALTTLFRMRVRFPGQVKEVVVCQRR